MAFAPIQFPEGGGRRSVQPNIIQQQQSSGGGGLFGGLLPGILGLLGGPLGGLLGIGSDVASGLSQAGQAMTIANQIASNDVEGAIKTATGAGKQEEQSSSDSNPSDEDKLESEKMTPDLGSQEDLTQQPTQPQNGMGLPMPSMLLYPQMAYGQMMFQDPRMLMMQSPVLQHLMMMSQGGFNGVQPSQ